MLSDMLNFTTTLPSSTCGAEPPLSAIILEYYARSGMTQKEATKYATQYLAALTARFGADEGGALRALQNTARKLETELASEPLPLKHARALEVLSHSLGAQNYRTVRAALGKAGDKSRGPSGSTWPVGVPRLKPGQVVTLYLECVPGVEYGETPPCARVALSTSDLQHVFDLMALVKQHNLAHVAESAAAHIEWAYANEYGVDGEELLVFSTSFFWRAYDTNGNPFETRAVDMDMLTAALRRVGGTARADLFFGVGELARGYFDEDDIGAAEQPSAAE